MNAPRKQPVSVVIAGMKATRCKYGIIRLEGDETPGSNILAWTTDTIRELLDALDAAAAAVDEVAQVRAVRMVPSLPSIDAALGAAADVPPLA